MTLSTEAPPEERAAAAPTPAPAAPPPAEPEPGANVPALWQATDKDLQVLRSALVDRDVTDDQFRFFIAAAKHLNLDPFKRQIYLVVYQGKPTLQTGIDGYRAQAVRTGKYDGQEIALIDKVARGEGDAQTIDLIAYGPQYPGREVWPFDATHPPYAAIATVWRKDVDRPFTAVALYSSYVRRVRDRDNGQMRPQALWGTMPENQLSKCAEALALRKAFPDELAGVYTSEEMEQAANDARAPERPRVDSKTLLAAWGKSDTDRRRATIAWLASQGLDGKRQPDTINGKPAPEHVRVLNDLIERGTPDHATTATFILETGDLPATGAGQAFDPDKVPLEGEYTEKEGASNAEGRTPASGSGR